MLQQRRGFFERLIEAIPEGTRSRGVALWQHPSGHLYHRKAPGQGESEVKVPIHQAESQISLLGLPVGYDWDSSPFLFLAGDDVATLSKEELKSLLNRNAVIDRRATECIAAAGLADLIGIRLGGTITQDQSAYECFDNADFCGEHAGQSHPLRVFVPDRWCRVVEPLAEVTGKVLSTVRNHNGDAVCPAVTAVETPKGRRFGVLGFSLNDFHRITFVHAMRRVQMRNLLEWVSGEKLFVTVQDHPFLVPQEVPLPDGRVILAFFNYSVDVAQTALISLNAKRVEDVEYLNPDGSWRSAKNEFVLIERGLFRLTKPIGPYDLSVYRLRVKSQ